MRGSLVHVQFGIQAPVVVVTYLPAQPTLELLVDEYRPALCAWKLLIMRFFFRVWHDTHQWDARFVVAAKSAEIL